MITTLRLIRINLKKYVTLMDYMPNSINHDKFFIFSRYLFIKIPLKSLYQLNKILFIILCIK